MNLMRVRTLTAVAMSLFTVALAGCAATVPMRPADDAANPDCAEVTVRLPDVIDDLRPETTAEYALRVTDAQATAAWGTPAVILLSCGVTVPGPTTQTCITIDGIDWIVDDSQESRTLFTTYGRDPAVQLVVDSTTAEANALYALAGAVGSIPATDGCTDPDVGTGP